MCTYVIRVAAVAAAAATTTTTTRLPARVNMRRGGQDEQSRRSPEGSAPPTLSLSLSLADDSVRVYSQAERTKERALCACAYGVSVWIKWLGSWEIGTG